MKIRFTNKLIVTYMVLVTIASLVLFSWGLTGLQVFGVNMFYLIIFFLGFAYGGYNMLDWLTKGPTR